jgi:hypothetical protein
MKEAVAAEVALDNVEALLISFADKADAEAVADFAVRLILADNTVVAVVSLLATSISAVCALRTVVAFVTADTRATTLALTAEVAPT